MVAGVVAKALVDVVAEVAIDDIASSVESGAPLCSSSIFSGDASTSEAFELVHAEIINDKESKAKANRT